jgi:protein-tyrosine phosphatase
MSKISVLFVCLGNICRSPLAEGVFRHLVEERGLSANFEIDSCGTGSWHIGNPPHAESCRVAKKHGVSLDGQSARRLADDDFIRFDHIVAMDQSNLADLKSAKIGDSAELYCLRKFDSQKGDLDVPDPYYGGRDGFEEVYQIVHRCCENLLDHLEELL